MVTMVAVVTITFMMPPPLWAAFMKLHNRNYFKYECTRVPLAISASGVSF